MPNDSEFIKHWWDLAGDLGSMTVALAQPESEDAARSARFWRMWSELLTLDADLVACLWVALGELHERLGDAGARDHVEQMGPWIAGFARIGYERHPDVGTDDVIGLAELGREAIRREIDDEFG